MKIDGDVCADKKKIADGFNKFFTGAVQRLRQEFGQIKDSVVNQSEPRVSGNKSYPEFKFQLITQNVTVSELKNLKCNKSSGMDNIPPRLLKDAAAVIGKPLTEIINTSLAMGAVPDEWKCAKVTPVFKKGKRSEMDNYRPISVLPVASKLLERASRLSTVTNFSIYVSGSLIERVSEFKYLGVLLDESLSWTAHVKYILGKAGKRVGMLSRIRTNVTTFILPVIDYCDTVWNCCGKVNSDNLEKLHRRAARLIVRNHCSDAALQSLAMESMENRRKKHVYRFVIKCMNGKFPQFFINYFNYNRDITGRQTRQSNLLHLPRVRTEAAKKSFFYSGAQIFNSFQNM